ncbi:MAG: 50S ribosomal protein L4, partial [Ktedonobacterales bacterium]
AGGVRRTEWECCCVPAAGLVGIEETDMPSASVYDMDGQVVREENLDQYVFGAPVNVALLHQVVTVQLTNRRQGNASTKTRAQVSGGNRKPYRQKGTGRARQGSTRAPHWRGGGSVFGPRPHSYDRAIPRKMKRLALRAALSDKAANNNILLMDELTFEEPRTKLMEDLLDKLPVDRNVLLLLPERNENVILSSRNIHRIKAGNVAALNVVELLKYEVVLMPTASVTRIVEMFGEEADDALQMKRHPNVVMRKRARRENIARQSGISAQAKAARATTSAGSKTGATTTTKTATTAKSATETNGGKKPSRATTAKE